MNRLTRNFIWEGSAERSINLVSWDTITQPKKIGGLGVRVACHINTSKSVCVARESLHPSQLRHIVSSYFGLLSQRSQVEKSPQAIPPVVTWHPTRASLVVLNVDGSSLGNLGPSGLGGLLRNEDGVWLSGFTGNIGVSNNLHAELLAMYHDLQFAWNHGHSRICVYSNSTHTIKLVSRQAKPSHLYASIIQNIKDLIGCDWLVQLNHTLREGNACADFLAKLGASMDHRWTVLDTPPPGIAPLLLADASGVQYLRF